MAFKLEPLPYPRDALAPALSAETVALHHGKHHAGYVNKLNALVSGTAQADADLESLVRSAQGAVFETAAQIWNHDFYWRSMKPGGGGPPSGELFALVRSEFGSLGSFRDQFVEKAESHFGSGWIWLTHAGNGLRIVTTHDAGCPLRQDEWPLLTADLWEHSYYVDYRNERAKYVRAFLAALVSWDFAAANVRAH